MSALAIAGATAAIGPAVIRPAGIRPAGIGPAVIGPAVIGPAGVGTAPAHPAHPGRARLRPVREAAPVADPVTITISVDGGSVAGRDRILAALRELVEAAGPDATVAVAPAPAWPAVPGSIRLDPRSRTVDRDGWPLHLSRLEYDLLLFLARHPRQVFSRSQLLAQVWGHTHTTARTVDVHVSRLRTKLGDEDLITTVYGLGYRLADEAVVAVAVE